MKTKYVCHSLISPHENFHNDRTMSTEPFLVKNCRWGGGGVKGKRALPFCDFYQIKLTLSFNDNFSIPSTFGRDLQPRNLLVHTQNLVLRLVGTVEESTDSPKPKRALFQSPFVFFLKVNI